MRGGNFAFKQFMVEVTRDDGLSVDFNGFFGEQSQAFETFKGGKVTGISQDFVLVTLEFPQMRVGSGGHGAGDNESFQLAKRREVDFFQFGEGRNEGDFPIADEGGLVIVFVSQAIKVEGTVVVPGRGGVAGQAGIVQVDFAGCVERVNNVNAHVVDQAGAHTTIGEQADSSPPGNLGEFKLLPGDIGVAAHIAQADAGFDTGAADGQVVVIGDSAQGDIHTL